MDHSDGLSRRDILHAGVAVAALTTGLVSTSALASGGAAAAVPRHVAGRRRPRVWSRPAYYVHDLVPHARHRAIALTIDDGPDPEWTPHVLRLLERYGVVANFCLVGIHVKQYPHLAQAIMRRGHAIVNHTYHHPQPFSTLSTHDIRGEITATQRAIHKATGVTPTLFRAPGGDWSHRVFEAIAPLGLLPLDWDVDPRDWSRPGTRAIVDDMESARPGDIVLCHDGGGDRSETVRALSQVLPVWRRHRLIPVRLS